MTRAGLALSLLVAPLVATAADGATALERRAARLACLDGDDQACEVLSHVLDVDEPAVPEVAPGLSLPREQSCLSGPSFAAFLAEDDVVATQGLGIDDIAISMESFLPRTIACLPAGAVIEAAWTAEVTVACTGRVVDVVVTDDGALSASVVACLEATLRFAPFPAHDTPDGVTFAYPARFVAR